MSKIKAVKPHYIKGGVTEKKWDIEGEICQWKVVEISKLLWDTCICIDVQCCNTIVFNKGKKPVFDIIRLKLAMQMHVPHYSMQKTNVPVCISKLASC